MNHIIALSDEGNYLIDKYIIIGTIGCDSKMSISVSMPWMSCHGAANNQPNNQFCRQHNPRLSAPSIAAAALISTNTAPTTTTKLLLFVHRMKY
jgi:hypothetical protein